MASFVRPFARVAGPGGFVRRSFTGRNSLDGLPFWQAWVRSALFRRDDRPNTMTSTTTDLMTFMQTWS